MKKHTPPTLPAAHQSLYGQQAPDSPDTVQDSEPLTLGSGITKEQVDQISQDLPGLCKLVRIALMTCHRTHEELTEGFKSDQDDEELIMTMIEGMQLLKERLSGLAGMADSAFSRLMVVAMQITDQDSAGGDS